MDLKDRPYVARHSPKGLPSHWFYRWFAIDTHHSTVGVEGRYYYYYFNFTHEEVQAEGNEMMAHLAQRPNAQWDRKDS